MAIARPIFANFAAGELSPLLYSRVDFAKSASGARRLENMTVFPQGPATRRAGTRFVAEVKDSTKKTYVLPFEFNMEQAYVIEFGPLYLRFYKDGGRIQLTVTGAANNGSGLIRITTSVAHTLSTGMRVVISGVLGTTEANATWTVTNVTATTFDLQGSALANAYVSGGVVIPDALTPYTETQLSSVKYIQSADTMYFFHADVSPRKLVRTSHTTWTLKEVRFLPPATFEGGHKPATTLTLGATTGLGITFTLGAALALAADVGRMITIGDGRAIVTANPLTTTYTVDIVDDFASVGPHASGDWKLEGSPATACAPTVDKPKHASTVLNLSAAGWRSADDVGKYVRVNKGVARIVAVTSTTAARAEILSPLSNATSSPSGSWSLEEGAWSATRGYPRCAAFFEQRLVVGGSNAQPQTFWGSASADFENFGLGADDDDSFEFKIAANDVNVIIWLVPTRVLLLGTASGEFRAQGGSDSAVTPTNIDVKVETPWGSSSIVRPLRISHAGIFVDRSGRDVREILFSTERDSYVSNNLILLAEHLTRDHTVTELSFQRSPHSTIWGTRSDGVLLSCTYMRDQEVVAWARHFTGPDQPQDSTSPVKGKFESVTVIPHWDKARDVAWFVVNRTLAAGAKRYIEYFDETGGFYGKLFADSSLTYSGAAATTVSGLEHLEGETVQILGDGAVYVDKVVTGGAVTLDPSATKIEVGLKYISTLETVDPEMPLQGASQGKMKHWAQIFVRLDKSLGCFVNDEELPFRSSQDVMDVPPPLFTGDYKLQHLGRDMSAPIKIQQKQPLPLTVVGVFGTLGVGE